MTFLELLLESRSDYMFVTWITQNDLKTMKTVHLNCPPLPDDAKITNLNYIF